MVQRLIVGTSISVPEGKRGSSYIYVVKASSHQNS